MLSRSTVGGEKEEEELMLMAVERAEAVHFHVLAVDDSFIDRKLIERLLKTSSYHVTTVDSGSKALEVLGLSEDQTTLSPVHDEVEVNLVITDYCMPGMTGYDLLKKIKGSSLLKDIPVVIMSSENVPSRINRCLEGGAEEFFLKPVQLSDMKKLKLHMLKGKSKYQELLQRAPQEENKQQQQQQEQQEESSNVMGSDSSCGESNNDSKRKAREEGISPERTRPRFSSNSLTVI